jgi:hypothetical protein
MNSREIVRRTLEFEGPERVAHSFPPSDFIKGRPTLSEGPWQQVGPTRWERRDAWGNIWGRVDPTSKGEVVRGALESLDAVETLALPDFSDPALYTAARATYDEHPDHWHLGMIHGFAFSIARKLRRLDQYFMDLLAEPDAIAALHDRIDAQIRHQIDGLAAAGADSIMFAEDWGTQERLLISPRLWRREFKPRFAALCDHAHARSLKVFMHSCGKITVIIPDLLEAGVDLFQFDQPTLHGLDTLAGFQQNHRITIWSPVDIQRILPVGDEATIRAGARAMLDTLWQGRGGFIAGFYEDMPSIGVEPQWQDWAGDEFLAQGRRELYQPA